MKKPESYFVHQQALCECSNIGRETRIWAFAHILPGAKIGKNCNICDHVFIENDVVVGDNVTVKSGVQLWDGIRIEANVFIGPNATFTNDLFPKSKEYPEKFMQTVVQEGASIGANSTILPGITVGYRAMVGAGAVVTKDVPPHAVVIGNPAHIINYQDSSDRAQDDNDWAEISSSAKYAQVNKTPKQIGVGDVSLWPLPAYDDLRGSLMVAEFDQDLPFEPKRSFFVHNVPGYNVRGEHAHHQCKQFLVAVHGELSIVVDDGKQRKEVRLDSPSVGLYLPPGIWGIQYKFSSNAVLAVFASHPYRADDYIRDYSKFLRIKGKIT